jgi:hypothetical protein
MIKNTLVYLNNIQRNNNFFVFMFFSNFRIFKQVNLYDSDIFSVSTKMYTIQYSLNIFYILKFLEKSKKAFNLEK